MEQIIQFTLELLALEQEEKPVVHYLMAKFYLIFIKLICNFNFAKFGFQPNWNFYPSYFP